MMVRRSKIVYCEEKLKESGRDCLMFRQESWDMGEERRKLHDSGCKYLSSAHSNILITIQTGGQ